MAGSREKAVSAWVRKQAQSTTNDRGETRITGSDRSQLKSAYGASAEGRIGAKSGKLVVHHDAAAGGKHIGTFRDVEHAVTSAGSEYNRDETGQFASK